MELTTSIGRQPRPDDVKVFMYQPKVYELTEDRNQQRKIQESILRHDKQFLSMVEAIMGRKEALERERGKRTIKSSMPDSGLKLMQVIVTLVKFILCS